MNICVMGTGYVGLVTGVVFADMGNEVVCVDVVKEKIDLLNRKIMPIYEPGLEEMAKHNMEDRRLTFSTDVQSAIQKAEIIFICVGTPSKDNGETNLSYVESAAKDIARHMSKYAIIVNKSTVPVGTGDFVRNIIEKNKVHPVEFDVVSNPEFLREGAAIQDALSPDRIVIGAPTKQVAMKLLELYALIGKPILITDVQSAEIIKYASNSFLAMKISFINAIANLCEATGANIVDVAKGIGQDRRIGSEFLSAGLGFGGSCFPKDVKSLLHTASQFGIDFGLLKTVLKINDDRVPHLLEIIRKRFPDLKGKTIGVLGLSFKPDTDDIRDAKSLELIHLLRKEGVCVRAYDPVAIENARKIVPDVEYHHNPYAVAEGADAIVVVTEWREFKSLNMDKIRDSMKTPVLFDSRNIYDPERKRKIGFEYYSIGRS